MIAAVSTAVGASISGVLGAAVVTLAIQLVRVRERLARLEEWQRVRDIRDEYVVRRD